MSFNSGLSKLFRRRATWFLFRAAAGRTFQEGGSCNLLYKNYSIFTCGNFVASGLVEQCDVVVVVVVVGVVVVVLLGGNEVWGCHSSK